MPPFLGRLAVVTGRRRDAQSRKRSRVAFCGFVSAAFCRLLKDLMSEKSVHVAVRFFGYAAELAECREGSVEVGDRTVAGVAAALRSAYPGLESSLNGTIRFAVGTEYASEETPVGDGDVVSLIPPVGGG